ncbi:hypothetical protein RP20_CCG002351 [Aedes albopictus]|nr:hypothetical protein RP20_CCG002351 [Aedes albopictus]
MKHGVYEEPQEVVEREHREVVFLEDGTYYMRGQTPEYLWEFETDTSAESEYEPYDGPLTEEEKEEDDEEEEDAESDDEMRQLLTRKKYPGKILLENGVFPM